MKDNTLSEDERDFLYLMVKNSMQSLELTHGEYFTQADRDYYTKVINKLKGEENVH